MRRNLAMREEQAQIAYAIVGAGVSEFLKILKNDVSIPVIKAIREQAKICAQRELEIALKKGYLKHSDAQEAQRLIHQVFKAFLHPSTINLKALSARDDGEKIAEAMRYVFNIENLENSESNDEI